jgi:hypothetical protein
LEALTPDQYQGYLIIGPAEIWPFIKSDRNVLIIDKARSSQDLTILGPLINTVDYILINKDYSRLKWEERFLRHFPNYNLNRIGYIGAGNNFIQIYELITVKITSE